MFAMLMGLVLPPVAEQAASVQNFQVAGIEMSLQPPAGFCPPQAGTAVGAMQLIAAADNDNVTNLALLMCDDTTATKADYYLIKTPKTMLAHTIDRPALLAEMKKAMALPEFNKSAGLADNNKIEKDFAGVVGGGKPEIEGAIKPLGVDGDCYYIGGVLSFKSADVNYTRAASSCITSIGGKMIAITRYSDGAVVGNMRRHLATARALAMAIKVVAAKH